MGSASVFEAFILKPDKEPKAFQSGMQGGKRDMGMG